MVNGDDFMNKKMTPIYEDLKRNTQGALVIAAFLPEHTGETEVHAHLCRISVIAGGCGDCLSFGIAEKMKVDPAFKELMMRAMDKYLKTVPDKNGN